MLVKNSCEAFLCAVFMEVWTKHAHLLLIYKKVPWVSCQVHKLECITHINYWTSLHIHWQWATLEDTVF